MVASFLEISHLGPFQGLNMPRDPNYAYHEHVPIILKYILESKSEIVRGRELWLRGVSTVYIFIMVTFCSYNIFTIENVKILMVE